MKNILTFLIKSKKNTPVLTEHLKEDLNGPITLGWNKKGNYFHTINRSKCDTLEIWNFWKSIKLRTILFSPGHKIISGTYGVKSDKFALLRDNKQITIQHFSDRLRIVKCIDLKFHATGIKYTHDEKEVFITDGNSLYLCDLQNMEKRLLKTFESEIHIDLVMPAIDSVFIIIKNQLILLNYEGELMHEYGEVLQQKVIYALYEFRTQKIFYVYEHSRNSIYTYNILDNTVTPLAKVNKNISGLSHHPEHTILGVQYEQPETLPVFIDFFKQSA